MERNIEIVLHRLDWMRGAKIWPNGQRHLWADAYGLILLVSLFRELGEERYRTDAEWLVSEVDRVLGRSPRGIRSGEDPEFADQRYHYLALWIFALDALGGIEPLYHQRALQLVREVHAHFVEPGVGVSWRMREDLSGRYPGCGHGIVDSYVGYVIYRLLDRHGLSDEIEQMRVLVERTWHVHSISEDLALGLVLWLTHFFPREPWAAVQHERALKTLSSMWIDPPGYFCREPDAKATRSAVANHGISIGLQAVGLWPARVETLNDFFAAYRGGDRDDTDATANVLACASHFPGALITGPRSTTSR